MNDSGDELHSNSILVMMPRVAFWRLLEAGLRVCRLEKGIWRVDEPGPYPDRMENDADGTMGVA